MLGLLVNEPSLMSLSFENSEHLGTVFVAVPMSQNLTLHFNKCLRACLSEKTAVHLGQDINFENEESVNKELNIDSEIAQKTHWFCKLLVL
jgi:hypothetical protein